jgi:hypothetical protein
MASLGGTEIVRPVRGLEVTKENGVAVWLSTRSDGSTVDLSPFFPQSDSGIAFAAFYANSLSEKTVLFNLQSALGARVFLNGLQVREVGASPLSLSGVDEFVATFQPGANLLLLEVPGVKTEALAAHFAAPFDTFTQNQFQNRSALEVKTGFEFNLTMKPMKAFSKILYDPSLENTGTFNGRDDTLFQDTWLTIFNPGDTPSPEFAYSATAVGATKRITKTIPAIPPNSPHRERISIPVGRRTPGQPVRVNSMLSIGRDTER